MRHSDGLRDHERPAPAAQGREVLPIGNTPRRVHRNLDYGTLRDLKWVSLVCRGAATNCPGLQHLIQPIRVHEPNLQVLRRAPEIGGSTPDGTTLRKSPVGSLRKTARNHGGWGPGTGLLPARYGRLILVRLIACFVASTHFEATGTPPGIRRRFSFLDRHVRGFTYSGRRVEVGAITRQWTRPVATRTGRSTSATVAPTPWRRPLLSSRGRPTSSRCSSASTRSRRAPMFPPTPSRHSPGLRAPRRSSFRIRRRSARRGRSRRLGCRRFNRNPRGGSLVRVCGSCREHVGRFVVLGVGRVLGVGDHRRALVLIATKASRLAAGDLIVI